MPKSKRVKLVTLSKTKKQARQRKEHLVSQIRESLDKFQNLYVFETKNMRNYQLKAVRAQWDDSRFFFGKNKVMILALGKSPEEEEKQNLSVLTQYISGTCGLLFTNKTEDEVKEFFINYREVDFARSGYVADQTIKIEKGTLSQFSHAIEPYLRSLGLPTILKNAAIQLERDFELCKLGEAITPEQAKLLKLFGHKLAEFEFKLKCHWDGEHVSQYED